MDIRRSLSSVGRALKESSERTLKKSTDLIDISRINIVIATKKNEKDEVYRKIGRLVYKKYKKEALKSKDVKDLFDEVEKLNKEIKELNKQVSAINREKTCPHCGESIQKKSLFCPICGNNL